MTAQTEEDVTMGILADHINNVPRKQIAERRSTSETNVQNKVSKFAKFVGGPDRLKAHREFAKTHNQSQMHPSKAVWGYETAVAFAKVGLDNAKEFADGLMPLMGPEVNRKTFGSTLRWTAAKYTVNPYLPLDEIPKKAEEDLQTFRNIRADIDAGLAKLEDVQRQENAARDQLAKKEAFDKLLTKNDLDYSDIPEISRMFVEYEKDGCSPKKMVGKLSDVENYDARVAAAKKYLAEVEKLTEQKIKELESANVAIELQRVANRGCLLPHQIEILAEKIAQIAIQRGVSKELAFPRFLHDVEEHYSPIVGFQKWLACQEQKLEEKNDECLGVMAETEAWRDERQICQASVEELEVKRATVEREYREFFTEIVSMLAQSISKNLPLYVYLNRYVTRQDRLVPLLKAAMGEAIENRKLVPALVYALGLAADSLPERNHVRYEIQESRKRIARTIGLA
ncbi:hypothetical protein NTE_00877 [Candidatus Nitrososphaera evergladensis SR1]|uniref:Uncharacterized protein n=1 Tax=Candidatus Nitrososphaera evergladensis SR1 TaxID=1459636 RepID=A0A075MP13_9ARCH|nr:hypothetical protein [Candidatus Nitrososphaera evergladensis]AIF82953.1 hypothetical protein NTE_00877 [Candidatus Nitrososphaera evergladensis SR1]